MDLPSVAVVVPTRSRAAMLPRVLAPLLADEATSEVVVVVDGLVDSSFDLLMDMAGNDRRIKPRLLRENKGRSVARQTGLHESTAEVVLLLDDDVVADSGLVTGHARHHASSSGLVVVGYMPVAVESRRRRGDFAAVLYQREYENACIRYEADERSILLSLWGGNVSLRRADALEVGLASPGFENRYHEDTDLGLRCAAAGMRAVFDRRLSATHHHERTWESFLATAADRGSGVELVRRRHGSDAAGPPRSPVLPWPLLETFTAMTVPVASMHPALEITVARLLRRLYTARGAADMRASRETYE